MSALPIMVGVLCVLAIAYRYYSAFLAARVATLEDSRVTPAHELNDGQNYHPTNKWVLFGHHFAAISGAGPLIGPVLAIQFGYMPGLIWLLVGVCLAGAVQDFLILAASLRHKGRSLAQLARDEIGPVSGAAGIAAILFIIVVALAGLGSAVVKALGGEEVALPAGTQIVLPAEATVANGRAPNSIRLPEKTLLRVTAVVPSSDGAPPKRLIREYPISIAQDLAGDAADLAALKNDEPSGPITIAKPAKLLIPGSAWGVFTIGMSIPIALFMGLWMYVFRKNAKHKIIEASLIGVVALLACVQIGSYVPHTWLGPWLDLSKNEIIVAMAVYGFVASILPVWLLLCPRDYLSSYLKIGTIAALILGVLLVNPKLEMPAYVNIWEGNGPNFKGDLFPFLFITIMCGAISGFHALVSSGTTPKMVDKESHARMIGYGAMLMEGLVGIVALIAAASLSPGDYYAIQVPMDEQAVRSGKLSLIEGDKDNLSTYELNVQENLRGRKGGAVTLAVGMSKIFSGVEFLKHLVGYWYHFAIMFEALFILTTIDTGTRIGRFLVQEVAGKINPRLGRVDWWPGAVVATAVIVFGWAYMMWSGDIGTIWPMFGIANQLLAVVAMCVATSVIINSGRARYAPVTILPLCFIVSTTMTAGVQLIGRFYNDANSFRDTAAAVAEKIANAATPAAAIVLEPAMAAAQKAAFNSTLNLILTAIMLVCAVIVLLDSLRSWISRRPSAATPAPAELAAQAAK